LRRAFNQTNAAASEQAASASEELSAQAQQMKSVVSRLALVFRGQSAISKSLETPNNFVPVNAKTSRSNETKIIQLSSRHTAARSSIQSKMASGSDISPREDDIRFKDI
jgi:hypothetical protein